LLRLAEAGYKLVVISNQAGIGRGYLPAQYRLVEAEVERQILPAKFDAVYFCPDHRTRDQPTETRPGMVWKRNANTSLIFPAPGLLATKRRRRARRNAGVRTILVKNGYGANEAHANPD
jgi:histidinol phosphatase-like enzyme